MNDERSVPRIFFDGRRPGPFRCMEEEEVPDAVSDQPSTAALCPSSVIPSMQSIPDSPWNTNSQGDDPVFSTSDTVPQLRHHQQMRILRVHSAPTLMEHEVGLALRHISDEFNDNYNQGHAPRTRRASHPETNNHRPVGFIDSLRRQFSRRSWTNSHRVDSGNASGSEVVHHPVMQSGVSIQSVPEEDEEEAEVNREADE